MHWPILAAAATVLPAELPAAAPHLASNSPETRTLRLTAGEMFRLAEFASARNDDKLVESILTALEQNPDGEVRAEARFRHAKLLMRQSRTRSAAVLLRQILDDKPEASAVRLELARLLQLLGDSDGALRELRAARAAGLPPAVARLVDRYSEALRAARPSGAGFEVALAPDSNINGSTRSDTLGTIFGDFEIDRDSKARSGVGIALRGHVYRRFGLGESDHSLLVRGNGFANLYSASSFNDVGADLSFGPELNLGRSRVNVELAATARWFGQKPFTRSMRLAAMWTRPLGSRMQVRASVSGSLIDNLFNSLQDGKALSAQFSIERALSATTGVAATLGLDRHELKDPGYSTTGWRLGFLGWRDIGRATLTASAEFGRLSADERLALFPHKRHDNFSRLSFGATFRQFTLGRFAPLARVTLERNRSSIQFYDYRRTRTEFGVVRAF